MNTDQMINLLSIIGAAITPVLIAIIGLRNEWNSKKAKKLALLETEKKEEQDKAINDAIEKLSNQIKQLEETVNELSDNLEKQDRSICSIARSSKINGQYTYKLAQMFMVLAEGMRDQHLDGNITKAIESFRNFESHILTNILTEYPDPNKDISENK